jgi:hypothetical protein
MAVTVRFGAGQTNNLPGSDSGSRWQSPYGLLDGKSPLGFPRQQDYPSTMLYTIVVVLVILWLLGFIGHIGGGLIHLLLVIAVIVLLFNFISGRR